MQRNSGFFLILLSFLLVICGCGQTENDPSEALIKSTMEKTPLPAEDFTDTIDSDETMTSDSPLAEELPFQEDLPPKDGMLRSRLTNEWVDASIADTRPIAIMVPNTDKASQYGLSQASVLYECSVENSLTRLMGIWDDWRGLDKIGNIRSSRDYYIYWAFEWDAIFVHYGGPFYVNEITDRKDTQNINCLTYADGSFRAASKNSTDNAFTSAEYIRKAIDYFAYPTAYRNGYADAAHYRFAPDRAPNLLTQYEDAITAHNIDMSPAYPVTNCYFNYNPRTGLYERFQHLSGETNGPHIDLANEKQLTFKNILVQNTYFEKRDKQGFLAFKCHDTTRDGWFFTNGRGIHVNWEKTSDYGATRYYDDAGEEIQFNTGKTMVCILQEDDIFMVGGKKIS